MTGAPKILAFAGSAREQSFNKKLIRVAAASARNDGAEVSLIDLRDFPIPLYDGDLEAAEGIPDNALRIKALMRAHDGLLISAPEYNSSLTPLLKNTIDWASRAENRDEKPLECYRGKTGALLSASPGGFGGMRGLVPLRALLSHLGVLLVPEQVCVSSATQAFGDDGQLHDERLQARLDKVTAGLNELTRRVSAERA